MDKSADPPYVRIVAEIRESIDTGVLAPGDRVPSTRDITRRWNVAMATASKVLTTLRQDGLVRAVPGVGTVVADRAPESRNRPRAQPSEPAPTLTKERIVAAAIAIADAEGLAALSMRRVASDIGVATMSLYRHVDDKDGLLLLMLDSVFDELGFPADPPADSRGKLEVAFTTLWAMFRKHPWLAPALSLTRPQPIPRGMAHTEWVLQALDGQGLDLHEKFTIHLTLFNYVRGMAINIEMESEAEAMSGLDNDKWMATQHQVLGAILASGTLPNMAQLFAAQYDFDLDALFEFGLQRLLDGLALQTA
ncbi:TetR/AcrR family transcriptional regulator C-terminal domain-containing protein [Antrihabitans stalactiti]|uniref:GntR family transcriptional regulator n=1 Tax=Antrihabitans stalactiti TaxID=2584121 RepID=A0A848KLC3_9NOCA|nr:TetR/AcrR family transcriptional regulator C-terminal domain-containing protein [Antrihabitans stalactiti]NMN98698.1 GntR family transcriptional regulator [Antrihabitans stalactiti]